MNIHPFSFSLITAATPQKSQTFNPLPAVVNPGANNRQRALKGKVPLAMLCEAQPTNPHQKGYEHHCF